MHASSCEEGIMQRGSRMRGLSIGAVAVGLLLGSGCKNNEHQNQGAPSAQKTVEEAQKQSQRAYDQAKQAQEKASSATKKAADTEQEAVNKQKEATNTQQKAQQERQQAQAAQQQAQQQGGEAQQQAQAAQQRASQAQQQAGQEAQQRASQAQQQASQEAQQRAQAAQQPSQPGAATTNATGVVKTATSDTIVLQRQGAADLPVKVDPQTTSITKDGQPAAVSTLQTGSTVSVSYRMQQGQAVAERIEQRTGG
jgi:membrane protein involved in colicin uptake